MTVTWGLTLLVLVVIAVFAGMRSSAKHPLAILIDSRNRYSLSQFQLVGWTLLIVSAFVAVFVGSFTSEEGPVIPYIDPHLLGLLGISVGSTVFAGGIKAGKNTATMNDQANVLFNTGKAPKFLQIIFEEEGQGAIEERISVEKFQNLVFTVVLWVFFVALFVDDMKCLPTLSQQAVWLIGISHSGYVAAKVPTKT